MAVTSAKKGLAIVQLDGVSFKTLKKAVEHGYMPFIKKLLSEEEYKLTRYFCEVPAKTTISEAQLFYGKSENIPSFAWYDRKLEQVVRGSVEHQIMEFERSISGNQKSLLKKGSSILGVFSGGASSSDYLYSNFSLKGAIRTRYKLRLVTLLFLHPFYFATLISNLLIILIYGFFLPGKPYKRLLETLLEDMPFFVTRVEIMRETPALFVDFVLFSEVVKMFGLESRMSKSALSFMDRYCKFIFYACRNSERDYSFIILSDHGQTKATIFKEHFGIDLGQLVKKSLGKPGRRIIETLGDISMNAIEKGKDIIVIPSGAMAHMYFSESFEKTYVKKDIDSKFPGLINNILKHPGIGWVLVRQNSNSQALIGKKGEITFENGKAKKFSGSPFKKLKMEEKELASFARFAGCTNNGDLVLFGNVIVNKVVCFERHKATHGGFYGDMLWPFIITNNKIISSQAKRDDSMKNVYKYIRKLRS